MNSFLNPLWVVLLALVSCTSRDEVQSSPFSGTGSISHQGILGSLLIRADGIADVSQYPEPFRDLLTDDCRIQITLLDPDIYGGSVAITIDGTDPEDVTSALIEGGILVPVPEREGVYQIGVAEMPGPMSGFGERLIRYQDEDRLILVPSVDLREMVVEFAEASDRELSRGVVFALALDGRRIAKTVRRKVLPMIEGPLLIAARAGQHSGWGEALAFASRLGVEVLEQTEGVVVQVTGGTGEEFSLRWTPLKDSPLAETMGALLPSGGTWPSDVLAMSAGLLKEMDGPKVAEAFHKLSETSLDDASLEFVEIVEEALAEVSRSERIRIAWGLDVEPMDVPELANSLGVPSRIVAALSLTDAQYQDPLEPFAFLGGDWQQLGEVWWVEVLMETSSEAQAQSTRTEKAVTGIWGPVGTGDVSFEDGRLSLKLRSEP